MNRKYCLDKKEWEEAQAALLLAKQLGLIEDAGIGALEKRRAEKNEKNRQAEKAGEFFYLFSVIFDSLLLPSVS